jgi:UDP-N-acetyl-D-mannosaminuronic acid dehydrogenase
VTFPHTTVLAVEPHIDELPAELAELPNVRLVNAEEALAKADVHALLVDHAAFRAVVGRLVEKGVVDTRGMTAGAA